MPTIAAPLHSHAHALTLEDVLSQRRSVRRFTARALSEDELLQLCWAAQGITHPEGYRTVPSAGALYPLELSVATAAGLFAYDPPPHRFFRRTAAALPAAARQTPPGRLRAR